MAKGFSGRSCGTRGRLKTAAFYVGVALILAAGCFQRRPSDETAALGDPLADIPVVLGNEALRLEQETRGIGTLFNQGMFEARKRDAETAKAEREIKIQELQKEIEERFAYVNAIEAIKNNIEMDCRMLPRYLEFISQIPVRDPTGKHLWKAGAVWVKLEATAGKYREFVEDVCTGLMARTYLGIADRVQNSAEARVQPSVSAAYRNFSSISSGYARETVISRLEQQLADLNKASEVLGWVGPEYFDMHHKAFMKRKEARGGATQPTSESDEIFSKTFEETVSAIRTLNGDVRKHIGVCKVYNNCLDKFARLLENGLQAKDVDPIKGLKKQLADKEPDAPSKDSANVLKQGRDEMDRRVEAEVEKMRQTRDTIERLCGQPPAFDRPKEYLGPLREGQDELLEIKSVFYALNLFNDAENADRVSRLAERKVRAFDKLQDMHNAQQEMMQYSRDLQQMPRSGSRTSAQRRRAAEIRKRLQSYRIRFSPYRSDPDLADYAEQSLSMVDQLTPMAGE